MTSSSHIAEILSPQLYILGTKKLEKILKIGYTCVALASSKPKEDENPPALFPPKNCLNISSILASWKGFLAPLLPPPPNHY